MYVECFILYVTYNFNDKFYDKFKINVFLNYKYVEMPSVKVQKMHDTVNQKVTIKMIAANPLALFGRASVLYEKTHVWKIQWLYQNCTHR